MDHAVADTPSAQAAVYGPNLDPTLEIVLESFRFLHFDAARK